MTSKGMTKMKKNLVVLMMMVIMMVAGVANAAPTKAETVDTNIMAALQQNVDANNGRTKESFMITGLFDIDTKVLVINMQTGQSDLYRLTNVQDFEVLCREQINCKDSRKPGSYTIVLQNLPMAEAFVTAAQQVTQTSTSKSKGPVFKLAQQKNRMANKNLDSFLASKGFSSDAVFITVNTGKLVVRPLQQVLDVSSKVNDLVSLPTTLKSSWNVLTNKSGW